MSNSYDEYPVNLVNSRQNIDPIIDKCDNESRYKIIMNMTKVECEEKLIQLIKRERVLIYKLKKKIKKMNGYYICQHTAHYKTKPAQFAISDDKFICDICHQIFCHLCYHDHIIKLKH